MKNKKIKDFGGKHLIERSLRSLLNLKQRKRFIEDFDDFEDFDIEDELEKKEELDPNDFKFVLQELVEEIAKIYQVKAKKVSFFISDKVKLTDEEKRVLHETLKNHLQECADPLKYKDIILCLLQKSNLKHLEEVYKKSNLFSVILLTDLFDFSSQK